MDRLLKLIGLSPDKPSSAVAQRVNDDTSTTPSQRKRNDEGTERSSRRSKRQRIKVRTYVVVEEEEEATVVEDDRKPAARGSQTAAGESTREEGRSSAIEENQQTNRVGRRQRKPTIFFQPDSPEYEPMDGENFDPINLPEKAWHYDPNLTLPTKEDLATVLRSPSPSEISSPKAQYDSGTDLVGQIYGISSTINNNDNSASEGTNKDAVVERAEERKQSQPRIVQTQKALITDGDKLTRKRLAEVKNFDEQVSSGVAKGRKAKNTIRSGTKAASRARKKVNIVVTVDEERDVPSSVCDSNMHRKKRSRITKAAGLQSEKLDQAQEGNTPHGESIPQRDTTRSRHEANRGSAGTAISLEGSSREQVNEECMDRITDSNKTTTTKKGRKKRVPKAKVKTRDTRKKQELVVNSGEDLVSTGDAQKENGKEIHGVVVHRGKSSTLKRAQSKLLNDLGRKVPIEGTREHHDDTELGNGSQTVNEVSSVVEESKGSMGEQTIDSCHNAVSSRRSRKRKAQGKKTIEKSKRTQREHTTASISGSLLVGAKVVIEGQKLQKGILYPIEGKLKTSHEKTREDDVDDNNATEQRDLVRTKRSAPQERDPTNAAREATKLTAVSFSGGVGEAANKLKQTLVHPLSCSMRSGLDPTSESIYRIAKAKLGCGDHKEALRYCQETLRFYYNEFKSVIEILVASNEEAATSVQKLIDLRETLVGTWCAYAQVIVGATQQYWCFKHGTRVNGIYSSLPAATVDDLRKSLLDLALMVMSQAVCCPIVGNHAWIAITHSRIIRKGFKLCKEELSHRSFNTAVGVCDVALGEWDSANLYFDQHLIDKLVQGGILSDSTPKRLWYRFGNVVVDQSDFLFKDAASEKVLQTERCDLEKLLLQRKSNKGRKANLLPYVAALPELPCDGVSFQLASLPRDLTANARHAVEQKRAALPSRANSCVPGEPPESGNSSRFQAFEIQSRPTSKNGHCCYDIEVIGRSSKPRSTRLNGPCHHVKNLWHSALEARRQSGVQRERYTDVSFHCRKCHFSEFSTNAERTLHMEACDGNSLLIVNSKKEDSYFGTSDLVGNWRFHSFDSHCRGIPCENPLNVLDYSVELFEVDSQYISNDPAHYVGEPFSNVIPRHVYQMGLRCRFCGDGELGTEGSYIFPKTIKKIPQSMWCLCLSHIDHCPNQPPQTREWHEEFRNTVCLDSLMHAEYWETIAAKMDLVSRQGGGVTKRIYSPA